MDKRKRLRLPDFDYSSNGAYFVTVCVKDMQCVLSSVTVGSDAHIAPQVELTKTGEIAEKYLKRMPCVEKYIIMPNHIHILFLVTEDNRGAMWASLPTSIRSFKTLVTKELGYSIWQTSYHDHIIRYEYDYMYHFQYIDENPKKWLMGKDEYYT